MNFLKEYDIIVVGAGHAGCEAALIAAKMGSKVLLITMDLNRMAQMSCNPAIGGIAKGQIVREIDALGGNTGKVADFSTVQFRMLNMSKGPAMWSPRAQCDKIKFSSFWKECLENEHNLEFWQGNVNKILFQAGSVYGVETDIGVCFRCKCCVLTTGTFLNGLMHFGTFQISVGRISEPKSSGITEQLISMGFKSGRMKTGTPVRIDKRSIDLSKLEIQWGDNKNGRFSYYFEPENKLKQLPCYITYTNSKVHEVIKNGFKDSPLFNGTIRGIGPRYCPSIETKLITFIDKKSHQLFLEPESENSIEYYLNGFSSSLDWNIQNEALHFIPGFEQAIITKPGYAIEYDYFMPTQLNRNLESKLVKHLFFAGQINGTTGYEEAAAQGLIAGINANLSIANKSPLVLKRNEAYIGVLIDDLVTKGVDEPYRMFTSRAEYRLLLRQDNADERLTKLGFEIGSLSLSSFNSFLRKMNYKNSILSFCRTFSVKGSMVNDLLKIKGTSLLYRSVKLESLLLRPQLSIFDLLSYIKEFQFIYEKMDLNIRNEVMESTEIFIKYSGYINREKLLADKNGQLENVRIMNKFEYQLINSLSTEARQKLQSFQPETIGLASRIPGVTPSDINVLLVLLGY